MYHEKLVVRGEFLLDMNMVKSWPKEVESMDLLKKKTAVRISGFIIHCLEGINHIGRITQDLEHIGRLLDRKESKR